MSDRPAPPQPSLVGKAAEDQALAYLQAQGLRLIERNFRSRRGEIDLVMEDRGCLVFVEVRYRRSARFGSALESVDPRKRARLTATAEAYLVLKRVRQPARFDVLALQPDAGTLAIEWIKNAIEPS